MKTVENLDFFRYVVVFPYPQSFEVRDPSFGWVDQGDWTQGTSQCFFQGVRGVTSMEAPEVFHMFPPEV